MPLSILLMADDHQYEPHSPVSPLTEDRVQQIMQAQVDRQRRLYEAYLEEKRREDEERMLNPTQSIADILRHLGATIDSRKKRGVVMIGDCEVKLDDVQLTAVADAMKTKIASLSTFEHVQASIIHLIATRAAYLSNFESILYAQTTLRGLKIVRKFLVNLEKHPLKRTSKSIHINFKGVSNNNVLAIMGILFWTEFFQFWQISTYIGGDFSDFVNLLSYLHVSNDVRTLLNEDIMSAATEDEQLSMIYYLNGGFEHTSAPWASRLFVGNEVYITRYFIRSNLREPMFIEQDDGYRVCLNSECHCICATEGLTFSQWYTTFRDDGQTLISDSLTKPPLKKSVFSSICNPMPAQKVAQAEALLNLNVDDVPEIDESELAQIDSTPPMKSVQPVKPDEVEDEEYSEAEEYSEDQEDNEDHKIESEEDMILMDAALMFFEMEVEYRTKEVKKSISFAWAQCESRIATDFLRSRVVEDDDLLESMARLFAEPITELE